MFDVCVEEKLVTITTTTSNLSLDYESPQNFLASPLEPKIGCQSFFSHASLSHYQTSFIVFSVYLLFFFVFVCVCLFAFYNFVQPLAITFNKQYTGTRQQCLAEEQRRKILELMALDVIPFRCLNSRGNTRRT